MIQLFGLISAVLKAMSLWDAFLDYMALEHSAEIEARKQARDKAIDDSKGASSDSEIWNSQDGIVTNRPKP